MLSIWSSPKICCLVKDYSVSVRIKVAQYEPLFVELACGEWGIVVTKPLWCVCMCGLMHPSIHPDLSRPELQYLCMDFKIMWLFCLLPSCLPLIERAITLLEIYILMFSAIAFYLGEP